MAQSGRKIEINQAKLAADLRRAVSANERNAAANEKNAILSADCRNFFMGLAEEYLVAMGGMWRLC